MSASVNERFLISPLLAFFVIHAIQWGIGYFSFQRALVQAVGQDAWIVVLVAGISFHIVIWMLYQILQAHQSDIVHIHRTLFGKWIGGLLSLGLILYFVLLATVVLRSFIETIQVWVFPQMQTWVLGLVLLLLAYYVISGGFRVIVGICVFSLVQYLMLPTYGFLASYLHFTNLTPVLEHSLTDLLQATGQMTFSYLGVEVLLLCYPFIKKPDSSQKWVHAANFATTLFYLSLVIFSLAFYSRDQLANEVWPTLTMFKFVQLPFFERFEFVGVSSNLIRVMPIMCLAVWAASRATKRLVAVKQSTVLPLFLLLIFALICLLSDRQDIHESLSFVSMIGLYLVYVYIPVLYILHMFRKKARTQV